MAHLKISLKSFFVLAFAVNSSFAMNPEPRPNQVFTLLSKPEIEKLAQEAFVKEAQGKAWKGAVKRRLVTHTDRALGQQPYPQKKAIIAQVVQNFDAAFKALGEGEFARTAKARARTYEVADYLSNLPALNRNNLDEVAQFHADLINYKLSGLEFSLVQSVEANIRQHALRRIPKAQQAAFIATTQVDYDGMVQKACEEQRNAERKRRAAVQGEQAESKRPKIAAELEK